MLPSLFVSHGSPMLALTDEPTSQFLKTLAARIPAPKAIIVASAHWETSAPEVTAARQPETIHDFYGFPKALYELRYPAPGDPILAERICEHLTAAGLNGKINPQRGLDHGAWSPLLLMYPQANIPVVEISVQTARNAKWHYMVGQALASLRNDDILIMGTGNLTHNLREAMRGQHSQTPTWVLEFAHWIKAQLSAGNTEALLDWQAQAPHAHQNHPTPEHMLPFFVALGAAGGAKDAVRLHDDITLGVLAMDAYFFGATA